MFQYENLQLDKDDRASSTSSCELLEPCNSDSSFYVIDPDNLECSIVSQLTESSARHLRNYPVLITKMFIINSVPYNMAERRLLGIEIPNGHLWMVQEVCMEG